MQKQKQNCNSLAHEKRLTEVEQRSKSNAHRLDEVERKQDDLTELVGTVKVLATKEAQVEADVKEIKDDVKNKIEKIIIFFVFFRNIYIVFVFFK